MKDLSFVTRSEIKTAVYQCSAKHKDCRIGQAFSIEYLCNHAFVHELEKEIWEMNTVSQVVDAIYKYVFKPQWR